MSKIFANMPEEFESEELKIKPSKRKAWQEAVFFLLLVAIMLTSTNLFSGLTDRLVPASWFASRGEELAIETAHLAGKLLAILIEIILVVVALRMWFTWDDTRKWLKRTIVRPAASCRWSCWASFSRAFSAALRRWYLRFRYSQITACSAIWRLR